MILGRKQMLGRYGKAAGLFVDLPRRLCCERHPMAASAKN
jgi:hypothetical protein